MSNIFEYKIVENGIELTLNKNGQKCLLGRWHGFQDITQLEVISIIENKVLESDTNFSKLNDNSGYFLNFDFVSPNINFSVCSESIFKV